MTILRTQQVLSMKLSVVMVTGILFRVYRLNNKFQFSGKQTYCNAPEKVFKFKFQPWTW